jgi:taurine dioxygenase
LPLKYQVRFNWRAGSVAMWDNRCTQHYAVSDYMPHYRCMNRITVVNDRRLADVHGKPAAA